MKWPDIAAMFDFPPAIRKAIYTTNAIESVNSRDSQVHAEPQAIPQRGVSVKLVYLAIHEASKNGQSNKPLTRQIFYIH